MNPASGAAEGVRTREPRPESGSRRSRLAGLFAAILVGFAFGGAGCGPETVVPDARALVVTQVPLGETPRGAGVNLLDVRYPAGSRVVLVAQPEAPGRSVVLSAGLLAAGDPVVEPGGRDVLFVGKPEAGGTWQVYRASLGGGAGPVRVTDHPGGVADPAWLPGRRVVYSAVPQGGESTAVSALFVQSLTGGPPQRLTFGVRPARYPTVLADGRVLFVSEVPREMPGPGPTSGTGESLFTVNNDGTEISPFAGQHDAAASMARPRETADGRVLFLAAGAGASLLSGRMECVLLARPYRSRAVMFPDSQAACRAAEPLPDGSVLASVEPETSGVPSVTTIAVYRLGGGPGIPAAPVFDDPGWHDVEAVPARHDRRIMGRIPSLDPARDDGVLLCLDVTRSDRSLPADEVRAGRCTVRVVRHGTSASAVPEPMGEARVHPDGSFLLSVPAGTALSLELTGAAGAVLARCPPTVWVQPGENRACVGCHEPHNTAPDNTRPLAVREPPVRIRPRVAGPAWTQGGAR